MRPLPNLQNTKLCESVTKGVPCGIPNCQYAHTQEDLRNSTELLAYKTSLCFFYRKGRSAELVVVTMTQRPHVSVALCCVVSFGRSVSERQQVSVCPRCVSAAGAQGDAP